MSSIEVGAEARKVVSIVFADLQGSTAIAERLDAEAARAVLSKFYVVSREVLERYGGTVEKFIGDAVMAVFGVPQAHEDDALRAVRASAELRDSLDRLNEDLARRYGETLQLRTGVNTGEVVVGDPASGFSFVSGDTVNVAARLEHAASAGEVLIGLETYRAVEHTVEVEPVKPLELKGKSERVPAFRLLRVLKVEARPPLPSPLVGREMEMTAILSDLEAVEHRGPRFLLVTGPPGIGKSRLIEEALTRISEHSTRIEARCLSEPDGGWALPVRQVICGGLGVPQGAGETEIVSGARALLVGSERAEVLALAAAKAARAAPGGTVDESSWAVREILAWMAADHPVAMFIDDLQWADVELLDLLRSIVSDGEGQVLVLAAARPEFASDAEDLIQAVRPRCRILELAPIGDSAGEEIVQHLLGAPLVPVVRDRLLAMAEGNPLFLGETLRMLRESGALIQGDGVWSLSTDAQEIEIPGTVRSLLAARMDLLKNDERAVLGRAAVIGETFVARDLASLLSEGERDGLGERLAALAERQFLSRASGAAEETFLFSHGLIREVAYESLTKDVRAKLHERYADLLEGRQEDPGRIGSHLERAVHLRIGLAELGPAEQWMAARAAVQLASSGEHHLDSGDRRGASALSERARTMTEAAGDDADARRETASLAFRLGSWGDVLDLLSPVSGDPSSWNHLGVALTRLHSDEPNGEGLERGRDLLQRAADAGDVDAMAALAGTWKGMDDERALSLYRAALEMDPSDPYALGNVLEYEVAQAGDLSPVERRRDAVEAAMERRRAQAMAGKDRPWSWFDLGKFQLLLGRHQESLAAYAAAVHTTSAAFMVTTSLRSLERLVAGAGEAEAFTWAVRLLGLAMAALFGEEEPRSAGGLRPPLWILAGGSSREVADHIAAYRNALVTALAGATGTLVSGGTSQGVSALAADAAESAPGLRTVGYVPARIPEEVQVDDRYTELRRTEGTDFSLLEPLQCWADILGSGIDSAEVRMLAIGGGKISALEYRIALALGAMVGPVVESGGAASDLLRDPVWATTHRLVEVSSSTEGIRAFFMPGDVKNPSSAR